MSKAKSPPPRRKSIILDPVHPKDFRELNFIYCCEQCSYFEHEPRKCNLQQDHTKHTRDVQLNHYERTGRMAFCRNLEIN
ncbi:MAG: hypothetical protein MK008_14605 [Bdellovibrionales bacterium]|nr:hypothetical protein [Bdellovibrionales bacterium]